jgi:predicted transcriptional regulator
MSGFVIIFEGFCFCLMGYYVSLVRNYGGIMSTMRILGTRQLIDSETGEKLSAHVVSRSVVDKDFKKLWLGHILEAVDEIGNAKMRILFWMLENCDYENRVIATMRKLSAETGTGLETVNRLLKALVKHNIVKREQVGVYRLNPNVIFNGTHDKRMDVLIRYEATQQELPLEVVTKERERMAA